MLSVMETYRVVKFCFKQETGGKREKYNENSS